ncbi:uncharacterized protein LOC143023927 isoform X2 [Oratosquilla oratoria]
MRLTEFLRTVARLSGVKVLCLEGGCGVCTVVATTPDLELGGTKTFSLQSCQALVYGCVGWSIETIEHLGDKFRGYNVLQKTLHRFYGTQCGYCSPGMIMTMHGHLKSKGAFKADEIEKLLDGNLCRCTGYRPIVDAFKSLAEDVPEYLKSRIPDIEDMGELRRRDDGCKGGCTSCRNGHIGCKTTTESLLPCGPFLFTGEQVTWCTPDTLQGVYDVLNKMTPKTRYRIVVGNTGQGVFKDNGPYDLFISTSCVRQLCSVSLQPRSLVLGSNVTLARAIRVFSDASSKYKEFGHLCALAKNWGVVANVGIRNVGCWAGNLMLKHAHRDFPSDIFLTLLSVGAQLTLGHAKDASTSTVSLEEFLDTDMRGSVVLAMTLPPMPSHTTVRMFKITPRSVNAHAYVNACFRLRVDPEDVRVLEPPLIAIGGINPDFIRAKETEKFINGRRLDEPLLIDEATRTLAGELAPDSKPQDASPEYRASLAMALLYKTLIGLIGSRANERMRSGSEDLVRPRTYSHQHFDLEPNSVSTLGHPMPKLESLLQVSGEAEFTNDIDYHHDELHGYFVQSSVANAKIKRIDPSKALKVEGVMTFLTAEDVPGDNFFTVLAGPSRDILFASDRVQYAGQALGLVVAKTHEIAKNAAKLVRVEYDDLRPPVIGIEAALAKGEVRPEKNFRAGGNIEETLRESRHVVRGQFHQGSQYHMCMEPHSARVLPTEDGFDVDAATQWPTETQAAIASVLRVPANQVHVKVRRLGGAFGAKISRGNVVATAAAVAAYRTRSPVRVNLDLQTSMTIVGWRDPYYAEYTVGFDDSGKLNGIKVSVFNDVGCLDNENPTGFAMDYISGAYFCPTWDATCRSVLTDTAPNTYVRAPGSVNAVAVMETMMDHVAYHLGKDPLQVRELNVAPAGVPRFPSDFVQHEDVLRSHILPLAKAQTDYAERRARVKAFNETHRWRKRGISVMPMSYLQEFFSGFRYSVHVTIYTHDGSVAVAHGGVEMGQGVNTKVAQVVANTLGIPLDLVKIRTTDSFVGSNSSSSAGSYTSDLCTDAAHKACLKLNERLDKQREKVKVKIQKDPTWKELLAHCLYEDIDLTQRYWTDLRETPTTYFICGTTCLEVEVDVLTGQYVILRADVIEDCGRSLNPYVDVGQVEGAFVMGLGLFSSELVKIDKATGAKLSCGTWEYKPMTAVDIPADFRVTLLPNPNNQSGSLRSKATGEPPLCMSYSLVMALRQAIASARADGGNDGWFQMDTPLTVERVQLLCNAAQSIVSWQGGT